VATEQSSIQRFLQHRAPQVLIGAYTRNGYIWQMMAAVACGIIGVSLLTSGLLFHNLGLRLSSIGPLLAGGINLYVGNRFRKKVQGQAPEARLSEEAKGFLHSLMRSTNTNWGSCGWNQNGKWQQHLPSANPIENGESIFHQLGKHWGLLPKTPKDILPKPVYDILEIACFHYNRVFGILEGSRTDSAVAKVSQSVRAGADEALFSVLHNTALMQKFPETISTSSRDCEEKIRALKELADRLGQIQTRPVSISDRLGYSSAMDSALEELRLEHLAREELKVQDQETLRERL
jgi:hypothetical protein